MDPDFWHARWDKNEIGFHEGQANTLMVAHMGALSLTSGARIFVPLCGKSRDVGWLLSQGFAVVGAELSGVAVSQLFDELGVTPEITEMGDLTRYAAPSVEIYVGDVFALDAERLGPVDAIYDRAALVALPDDLRTAYAAHLVAVTSTAPQLLITFSYDQSVMSGPPFSIDQAEVTRLYEGPYAITMLEDADVIGGLKGRCPAREAIWHLQTR